MICRFELYGYMSFNLRGIFLKLVERVLVCLWEVELVFYLVKWKGVEVSFSC